MNMNLRKIIREEIDNGYYIIEDEDGFMLIHYEDLLKIEPHLYKIIKYLPTVDFYEARDLYYKYLNNPITESEDFEWVKGYSEIQFNEGDKVLIRNVGSEKDFINWLGDHGMEYKHGSYGKEIKGEVIRDNRNNERPSFALEEERLGSIIIFPYKEYQKFLNSPKNQFSKYDELEIEYYLINEEGGINESEGDDMDWIREAPISLPKDHKPKEGSIMICIPGFTEEWNTYEYPTYASDDPNYGGGGYQEGKVITVERVVGGERTIIWPREGGHGIYVDALNYY